MAAVNGYDTLGKGVDQFLLMGDYKNSSSHLVYLLQKEHKLQRAHRVKVAGRLVRDYHARAVDQRAGNGHTLLLAAGKLLREALLAAFKADMAAEVTAKDEKVRAQFA